MADLNMTLPGTSKVVVALHEPSIGSYAPS